MTDWAENLLDWFDRDQRSMPWRSMPIPYYVWVSEIMLQQTKVDTVIPFFRRFIKQFPSIKALAAAELQQVLKAWEGLGYYSRARNLHAAARLLVSDHGGELPRTFDELKQFPGLGPYTAAAVASIAFGEAIPAVDGNTLRVFARFRGIEDPINRGSVKARIFRELQPLVERHDPSRFNQAFMELGALVCRPQRPRCLLCPLHTDCRALAAGRTSDLPQRIQKPPVPQFNVAVGLIWRKDAVLIARRPPDKMLGGLWEFPGGKCIDGESPDAAVVRKVAEETGLNIEPVLPYCSMKHSYTHFKITLTAFKCRRLSGRAQARSSDEIRWVRLDDISNYPFARTGAKIIETVRAAEAKR